jgi:hypothetical protein
LTLIAHGLVAREDLPIPEWLFGWAAAIVLVISFLALAALWREPKLDESRERPLVRIPGWLDPLCGTVGVAAFGFVVYAGFAGSQTPTANILPTTVYVLFWVCLVPLSALFGDIFRPFNPWRAVGRAIGSAVRRVAGGGVPEPLPYPERLGRWPAVIGLLAFGWVELVATDGDDPSVLAALALGYATAQFVGMALYGVERWIDRGDAFGVYFGLFARLAPLTARDGTLLARRLLTGLAGLAEIRGTIAFVCTAIGVTAFDGGSEGSLWASIAPDIQDFFRDLGAGTQTSFELAFTVGLIASVLLVATVYRLGVLGMRTVESGHSVRELATRFAPSLVPIALAYVFAHYFSLAVFQGQATVYLVSDPLGEGSNIFGTAQTGIDYGVLSSNTIWYVQVGTLVAGHVTGLALAHDRALTVFRGAREATRSQYWMLAVMVAFTTFGLWLLSSSNA